MINIDSADTITTILGITFYKRAINLNRLPMFLLKHLVAFLGYKSHIEMKIKSFY
jgi:hypothetical protein